MEYNGRTTLAHYGLTEIQLDIVYSALKHGSNLPQATRDVLSDIASQYKMTFILDKRNQALRMVLINNEYEVRLSINKMIEKYK